MEVGEEASVDAAAIVVIFNAVVRIADSTDIPLEEAKAELSPTSGTIRALTTRAGSDLGEPYPAA